MHQCCYSPTPCAVFASSFLILAWSVHELLEAVQQLPDWALRRLQKRCLAGLLLCQLSRWEPSPIVPVKIASPHLYYGSLRDSYHLGFRECKAQGCDLLVRLKAVQTFCICKVMVTVAFLMNVPQSSVAREIHASVWTSGLAAADLPRT